MTQCTLSPCEQIGLKEGDEAIAKVTDSNFYEGEILILIEDDNSCCPYFESKHDGTKSYYNLDDITLFKTPDIDYAEDTPSVDLVNTPPHYRQGEVECIEAIRSALTPEEFKGYCKGNSIEYVWYSNHKGTLKQDLDKAIWYLDKLNSKL